MKRIVCLTIAFIMCSTLFSIPFQDNTIAYADNIEDIQLIPEEKSLEDVEVVLSKTKVTYTGKEQTPAIISVKYDDETLVEGTDYTVVYSNNIKAGTATVILTGIGAYTGEKTVNFTIAKASIAKATVSLPYSNYYYIKNLQKPEPTVKLNGKVLKKMQIISWSTLIIDIRERLQL